jgi:hypothetical protein
MIVYEYGCVKIEYPVVAITVNVPLVDTVGVPERTPAGFSTNPAGRVVDEYD